MSKTKDKKYNDLLLGLLFDAIGMLSFAIPLIGDFTDVIWAPVSAWLMTRMYRGKVGQAAAMFSFIEEIVPGLDIVPSFTIMWLYTHFFKGRQGEKVVEVK
ncbi:MAG: hypothetical protein AAFX53_02515 [Bacteroidota bacterium]